MSMPKPVAPNMATATPLGSPGPRRCRGSTPGCSGWTHGHPPLATLIAARRLADDPRAAFRAVSGVALALFIFTVAAAPLATQDAKHFTLKGDAAANNTLLDEFSTVNESALETR
jgi:hypothetical protein